MKGHTVSQTEGFQNHIRPKFKFQFHPSSVGKLVNKSASSVLRFHSVEMHTYHIKSPESHPQHGDRKTQNKTRYFKVGDGACHLAWQLEFHFQIPPGEKNQLHKSYSDLYTGMSAFIQKQQLLTPPPPLSTQFTYL